ncbi:MAG: PEP-CTERM sorting domain-containing protein [Verrucomicrobia bacterium]|nr:PEP-CTERM sorting domain-containing protein [Verrucomicrobiota bacterium]
MNMKLNMKLLHSCGVLSSLLLAGFVIPAPGQHLIIEPDDYPEGAVLNHIIPQASLITAGPDNLPYSPASFDITATQDPEHFTSTGIRVFGHVNIPFMSDIRRLRLDFSDPVASLSIDFIGSGFTLLPERGHLEAYDLNGTLLAAFVTDVPGAGIVAPMSIQRPEADIAWAVAWSEGLTFGRLDNLCFSPVPEPSAGLLLAAGLAVLGALRGAGVRARWCRARSVRG